MKTSLTWHLKLIAIANKQSNLKVIIKYLLLTFALLRTANAMEVAITVDDLPYFGPYESYTSPEKMNTANAMLEVFKKHKIQGVYGFINGYKVTDDTSRNILKLWVDSGQLLGNHTYSHMNITNHTTHEYTEDINNNEPILASMMSSKDYRYFRYPFLREGNTKDKRDLVRRYLLNNNYKIAEVTLDFWDYEWNAPYARCTKQNNKEAIEYLKQSYLAASIGAIITAHDLSTMLFKRDIKYIMLIHIGALDAIMLDQVLSSYEKLGVKFIPLPVALSDKVYSIDSGIVRDTGYTFLNEIRLSRKLANPKSVTKFYDSIPEDKLGKICGE